MNEVLAVRPIEILMAEDNPGDVRLTREALKQNGAERGQVLQCNITPFLNLHGFS